MIFNIFFIALWFFSFNRKFLFWIYLWQLKEYHFGRFLDHFETEKGKKIILNKILFLKGIIIFLSLFFLKISYLAFPIFFLESFILFQRFYKKTLKTPLFTKKVISIFLSGLIIQTLLILLLKERFLLSAVFYLLVLDFLVPLFSTLIIFIWHPLSYLWRINLLKKAREKIKKMDNLVVIGITGSYGKTSTKEFLSTILSEKYNVLKTKRNQNSEVGISNCILKELNESHDIFICEMGAYNKGGIKLLCNIINPKIGILTGINQQHMATFGSQENIIKTKFELIKCLPKEGKAILNWDNENIRQEYETSNFNVKKKILYSTKEESDFFTKNIKSGGNWISFDVFSKKGESAKFNLNISGIYNISNILASVAVANEMDMSLREIAEASTKIKPEQGGTSLERSKTGLNIINASYSSNPNGIIAHLLYLNKLEGKKIIIMPCIIELGKSSKKIHRNIGKEIGKSCDLAIITTKERFKELKEGIESLSDKRIKEIVFLENPVSILKKVKNFCSPEDVLLLEGRVPIEIIRKIKEF